MLVSQIVWLTLILGLFSWWGHLLRSQGQQIAELETATGISSELASTHLDKLNRIVFWEAGTMVLLVISITLYILWLFLRDARRARSVQSFFAGVTHELRTPMTSIRLQAESIAEKTDPADPKHKLVDRLLEDAGQLESHLEQTLELAHIESGASPQLQAINLDEFLQRFLDDWRYTHGTDNPTISHNMGVTECMADPVALKTIFRNLLENTLKHSGKPAVKVFLHAETQGQHTVVRYRDDGQGFTQDPRVLSKVFAKGQSSTGSGVGLYLITALMQLMHGSARFISHNGFNAELEFPAATTRKDISGEY
jgi:signal transduction histidine kinase